MDDTTTERSCECGMPDQWVVDPHFPVEFDERMNEYNLVIRDGSRAVMEYCFWCGGKLPEAKRGDFFTTPSETEMAEVRSLLKGARSHEDVRRVLGPPDEIYDGGGFDQNKSTGAILACWEQSYRYTTRWKTLVLWVPVITEGQFSYAIHGHYLPGKSEPDELASDDRQPPQCE